MKDNYNKSISLRCATCGDTIFDFNEDKSWIKCKRCGREYNGGYDELVELNQGELETQLNQIKKDVTRDLKKDFENKLKKVFKGNKNIKFK